MDDLTLATNRHEVYHRVDMKLPRLDSHIHVQFHAIVMIICICKPVVNQQIAVGTIAVAVEGFFTLFQGCAVHVGQAEVSVILHFFVIIPIEFFILTRRRRIVFLRCVQHWINNSGVQRQRVHSCIRFYVFILRALSFRNFFDFNFKLLSCLAVFVQLLNFGAF